MMKKLLVLVLAGLLCAESAYALGPVKTQETVTYDEPEYPFEVPKMHYLSDDKLRRAYRYVCIDGYVYVSSYYRLSQVLKTSNSGNLTPIRCPICLEKEKND